MEKSSTSLVMDPSPDTTIVTIVTLSATYVFTTQFRVISRCAHIGMEQNRDCTEKWVEARLEVGSNKPEQLVA